MTSFMIMYGVISAKNILNFKIVYKNIIYISFHCSQTSFILINSGTGTFSKRFLMKSIFQT